MRVGNPSKPTVMLSSSVLVGTEFRTTFDSWLYDTFGKVDVPKVAVNNPNCNDCFYYAKIGHRAVCQSLKGDNLMQCNPHTMRLNNRYWCPEGYVCE